MNCINVWIELYKLLPWLFPPVCQNEMINKNDIIVCTYKQWTLETLTAKFTWWLQNIKCLIKMFCVLTLSFSSAIAYVHPSLSFMWKRSAGALKLQTFETGFQSGILWNEQQTDSSAARGERRSDTEPFFLNFMQNHLMSAIWFNLLTF